MPKKSSWPPRVTYHAASGQDRMRWRGKTHYLGRHNSPEARRRYAELVEELSREEGAESLDRRRGANVGDVVARWKLERGTSHTQKEYTSYARALEVFEADDRRHLLASKVSVSTLAECRRVMIALGWCRNVVNRQITRVCTVWRWAEESGLAPAGSWAHLRTLRALPRHDRGVRQTEPIRPAAWEDVQAVLAHLRSPAVRAMLLVQWWTGARAGEVRRMHHEEIDRTAEVWVYRPAMHKNAWRGHARVILLGPQAQQALAGFTGKGLVFRTRQGEPYTDSAYGSMVGRAAAKAGLPWFRPLCLRHGARIRITRECGIDAAREILGHTSVSQTLHYGSGQDLGIAAAAARRVG